MRSIVLVALIVASFPSNGPLAAQSLTIPELVERTRPEPLYLSRVRELVPPPFAELVDQSDLIVRGVVAPVRTYMSADQKTLYTDFQVTSSAVILQRGAPASVDRPGVIPVVFTQRGGRLSVNGVEVVVQDLNVQPLTGGEQVIAFLRKGQQTDRFAVVGEIAGVFTVDGNGVRSRLGSDAYKEVAGPSIEGFVRTILEAARESK